METVKNDYDLCKEDLKFYKEEFEDIVKPELHNVWKSDGMIVLYTLMGFFIGTQI